MPNNIRDVSHLEDLLSQPTDYVARSLARAPGDTIILGVGGKMGPSLTRMLVRACDQAGDDRKVIAVSRFSDAAKREQLDALGVQTIAGDLLDEAFVDSLPSVPNVIQMTGMKFGTSGNAGATWAMNTHLPSLVCKKFRDSRIMAFSTGNVYPLVNVESAWSRESDDLQPVGEYAMSALGRERMFEYFCTHLNIPVSLVRLNYAVEMRYGVLVDIAKRVYDGEVIDLSMGFANVIWQGDANALAIAALADAGTPVHVVNVAGPELVNVHDVANRFAELFEKPVNFMGHPASTALLNDGSAAHKRYAPPRFSVDEIIGWIADWISREQPLLGKPTHFEVRSGKF